MTNRLTHASRWPLDLKKRIERAETDIAFAHAMTEIMGECVELNEIALRAYGKLREAKQQRQ